MEKLYAQGCISKKFPLPEKIHAHRTPCDVSIPYLHCVVNKRKEGGQGKGTGEHCDESELDDQLEVFGDDHGWPGRG